MRRDEISRLLRKRLSHRNVQNKKWEERGKDTLISLIEANSGRKVTDAERVCGLLLLSSRCIAVCATVVYVHACGDLINCTENGGQGRQ